MSSTLARGTCILWLLGTSSVGLFTEVMLPRKLRSNFESRRYGEFVVINDSALLVETSDKVIELFGMLIGVAVGVVALLWSGAAERRLVSSL